MANGVRCCLAKVKRMQGSAREFATKKGVPMMPNKSYYCLTLFLRRTALKGRVAASLFTRNARFVFSKVLQ
jgi:hypothetical protein